MATAKTLYFRAIAYHSKQLTLQSVARVKIAFDPFLQESHTAREMLHHLSVKRLRMTNLNCDIKPVVKSDMSKPVMEVDYADGHKAIFKLENLTTLDTIKYFSVLAQEHETKSKTKKKK